MQFIVECGIYEATSIIPLFPKAMDVCLHVAGYFELVISFAVVLLQIWFDISLMP